MLLACGILAALVILGALGAFLLNDDPTSPAQDTTEPSADTTDPSADTTEPSPDTGGGEPTGDQSSPPDDDGEATGAGSPETFVSDYYAVLPEDTETGWSLLTAGFQREVGSFEDYDAFWSTIDSVTVEDTQPAGTGAVDVTLTYTTDGSSEQEVRRIEVVEGGDGYLISGDAVVG